MKYKIHADQVAYGAMGLLAVGALVATRPFPHMEGGFSGPDSFPRFLSVALAALALIGWFQKRRVHVAEDETNGRSLLVLGGLSAVYWLLMPQLGFISGTALFGVAVLWALGYRNPVRALAAGFVGAFALYGLFGGLMNVPLPQGWLG